MIVVTGGTHGIGAAVVLELSSAGHGVVFTGRDAAAGSALAGRTANASFLAVDSGDAGAVDCAISEILAQSGGVITGLVNNAGTSARSGFLETTVHEWDRVMAINARATFQFTRGLLPAMLESRGSVVNVASIAGKVGEEGLAAYCASKGAVISMTQALALEYGDRVRFNAVCPGQIGTRMMDRIVADPVRLSALTRRIPAQRLGQPEEVANVICWLLSGQASYVNGAVITIDGGETAGYRTPAADQRNPLS
jgi:NAD(P)-dependent dehydrogenase (short-subunit alcohol dehydrogenase family)